MIPPFLGIALEQHRRRCQERKGSSNLLRTRRTILPQDLRKSGTHYVIINQLSGYNMFPNGVSVHLWVFDTQLIRFISKIKYLYR